MKKHNKLLSYLLIVSFLISLFPSISFAGVLKIKSIKNLNSTVYVNTNYSLPKMVDGTMSNDTAQKVEVTWNPKTVVTSKLGTFVYKGTVKGYAQKVLLTLKVVALPKQADTNESIAEGKDTTTSGGVSETKPLDTNTSSSETKDANTPKTQDKTISTTDAEILRAISYGFVPDNIQGDWEQTITYKQYCQMLTSMISKYDNSYLQQWDKLISTAEESNDNMLREDGILTMSYAAVLMGINKLNFPIDTELGISQQEMDDQIKYLSWNYRYFPNWDKIVYTDSNYMWGGVTFLSQKRSLVSMKTIYPYDFKAHSMHLNEALTRNDAILAVLRFYESQHRDVSAELAKKGTVSASAKALAEKMPNVTSSNHPSWHGICLDLNPFLMGKDRAYVTQDDIAEIAGMGFNYVRLMIRYEDFTDSKNGTMMLRQDVLENFDRIVEWCAEYKLHLSIAMQELPGYFSGFTAEQKNILENRTNHQNALLICDVMSSRYADVPSNLVSYNLINEPDSYFTKENYAAFANEMISVIRSNDKTNKLIDSDGMIMGDWGWDDGPPSQPNELLDKSIMQSIHLYPYCGRSNSGYLNLEKWPYEHVQAVNNYVNNGTSFNIKGNFKAGTVVTLYIDNVYGINKGGTIECTADGNKIITYPLNNIEVGKDNCSNIQNDYAEFGEHGKTNAWEVKFTLPSACKTISVSPSGGSSITINVLFLRLPSDTTNTYAIPDSAKANGFVYETGKYTTIYIDTAGSYDNTKTSTVTMNPDSSYTVENEANKVMFDYKSLRSFVKKWADWSKSTGTPIMCNEFGVPVGLSEKARTAYVKSVLDLFKEYNISWCLYNNSWETSSPVVSDITVKQGHTILPPDNSLTLKNGFWYDTPMLELFRDYMK